MAALTDQTKITRNEVWKTGGTSGRRLKAIDVNLELSSQGGLTNSIAASLFGLSTIEEASGFRDSSSVAVAAGPSYDRTKLVFYAVETNGNPADVTGTFRGIIKG